jgi:hypothetical protein
MVLASLNPGSGPGRTLMTRSFAMPAQQVWDTGLPKPVRVLRALFRLTHETASSFLKLLQCFRLLAMPVNLFITGHVDWRCLLTV